LVVALLTPLVLQNQVLDAYVVSTPSMEPTIEGDPSLGDRVLVDKLWDNLSRPSRFHLVVFHHKSKTVVKRVVGLPMEWLKIEDFDLWIGDEASSLRRIQKSPSKDWDMFSTYWDSDRSPGGFHSNRWTLNSSVVSKKGEIILEGTQTKEEDLFAEAERIHSKPPLNRKLPWHMRFMGTITTGYIDGFGRLKEVSGGKNAAARDFGIKGNFRLQDNGKLWILYRYIDTPFILIFGGGQVRVWKDSQLLTQSPLIPALKTKKTLKFTFLFLDGRFCLALNGQDVWEFEPRQLSPKRLNLGLFPGNSLMLASSGGNIEIKNLKIIHDFHYLELGNFGSWSPIRLQQNQYFVLGDNSRDSQDSRHFGPIQGSSIIGRPLMVAAPWSRFHFFHH